MSDAKSVTGKKGKVLFPFIDGGNYRIKLELSRLLSNHAKEDLHGSRGFADKVKRLYSLKEYCDMMQKMERRLAN